MKLCILKLTTLIGVVMYVDEITPETIKEIRGKYGLSQQSFAKLLGIGEASMVRYENGQEPSKANANLIRAASSAQFMRNCIQRDGDLIPPAQRERAEQIICTEVTFDENGEIMDMTDRYFLTLDQEVLNEQAAEILGDLMRFQSEAEQKGDEISALIFNDLFMYLSQLKAEILWRENDSRQAFLKMKGKIESVAQMARRTAAKAA